MGIAIVGLAVRRILAEELTEPAPVVESGAGGRSVMAIAGLLLLARHDRQLHA